ncbi:pectinesterase family protein [Massilia sp. TWP1-3-3]|uniref:pectinesterase family protein n=1 Tax=Massilia sp. TWP1-3-3 TaxID=2804573 RepID=UPI003CE7F11C
MSALRALAAAVLLCSVPARAQLADGWAGQDGGTSGGGAVAALTVSSAAELRAALAGGARVIEVAGIIDMRDGKPFASRADQQQRGTLRVPSNTTLTGAGSGSGLLHASLVLDKVSNVIIRKLNLRNPCDVDPLWDPEDGPKGHWNAQFDAITVSASRKVWIDHNSFTDAPHGDQLAPLENGMPKQCHDGALDISHGADLVTVSYNRFALHEKNSLIGSSDNASDDRGRLHVTFSNNLFEFVSSRAPRVRFGQVHLYNNYHVGARRHAAYPHQYSVGVGKEADIIAQANVYEIDGARGCADVVRSHGAGNSFLDAGSTLNGAALSACALPAAPAWQVPYPFTALPAPQVKQHVLANAGAGNWEFDSMPDGAMLALAPATSQLAPATPDFHIEARIGALRPATGNGQLVLLGRQQAGNWSGAGLALADGVLEVNVMRMQDGVLTRVKQLRRFAAPDRRPDLLRVELAGSALTVYLNGEKLGTVNDARFAHGGTQVGFYSQGNAFQIDQASSGAAADKPARLALSGVADVLRAQAGDGPLTVPVSALGGDGATPVAFSARSDNPRVASVTVSASGVTVVPVSPGETDVLLSSPTDPALQTWFSVKVGPRFGKPPAQLPAPVVFPPPGARGVPVDTPLRLTFAAPPVLGEAGSVRIYRKRDMALVDIIRPGEEVARIGPPKAERHRYVRSDPIRISQRSAYIALHAGVLGYDTEYLVIIGAGVFKHAVGRWSFRTRKDMGSPARLVVDDDGPADFRTVQGALDHAMARYPKAAPLTIAIRNGSYEELLFLRARDRVTLRGESADGVVIHATNNEGMHAGSGASATPGTPGIGGGRALLLAEELDLLTLASLTLRNDSERRYSRSGQAETIYFNSDAGRLVARDARFFSEQDTLQLKGYAWFYRTLVAGNVDFIWGANRAALFEQSEIRSLGDSANQASGGYIVQARTVAATEPGFVFLDSVLTHGAGPAGNAVPEASTYLARSPGTAATWDNVSFINCRMDRHIAPGGWAGAGVGREPAPNPAQADAAHGWREHGSTDLAGAALDLSQRSGGHVLDAAARTARFGSRAKIFASFNNGKGWNPPDQ